VPFETIEDFRSTFFEIDGGPAIRVLIQDLSSPEPGRFAKTIAAIFSGDSQPVTLYDTNTEAPIPSILCVSLDIEDIEPGYAVRFLGLLPGEEGYSETFEVAPRIAAPGVNTARIYLKKL
jgi:hypothetical protein